MPKVTAYLCPWTKRLFRTQEKYIEHLKRYRTEEILHTVRARRSLAAFEELYEQQTISSIVSWLENNPQVLFDNAMNRAFPSTRRSASRKRDTFSFKVNSMKLTWVDSASNSHAAPRNGVKNWERDPSKPMGYPGWAGSISYSISHDIGFSSGIFEGTCLNTGSGGGGYDSASYSITLFDSDWPGLSRLRTWHILQHGIGTGQTLTYTKEKENVS